MPSPYASRSGFVLVRTPSYRRQQMRRRLAVIAAVAGLAIASGVIGAMSGSRPDPLVDSATGPFSYFPSQ